MGTSPPLDLSQPPSAAFVLPLLQQGIWVAARPVRLRRALLNPFPRRSAFAPDLPAAGFVYFLEPETSNHMNTEMQVLSFSTLNDLSYEARTLAVDVLNARLADLVVLHSLAKQMHWNVKGVHFRQLHELYDDAAGSLLEAIDMVAERVVQLGGVAEGSAARAIKTSDLHDIALEVTASIDTARALASRWSEVALGVRASIGALAESGDEGSLDLLTEVSRLLDKYLWFIEAHFQTAN
ncbi:MAG: starvation-inducible DNA-binding protein [Planctomycetota bacterium]